MNVFHSIDEMHAWSQAERSAGKRIAFVPTMGFLHEGHLSLMREGKRRADRLVSSIYVNPIQFGPNEDLARYPRDLEGDLVKCKSVGCDAVVIPTEEQMYPKGYETYVTVEGLSRGLCGESRPGHFRGVATVVLKLFHIVQPHIAIFGEKDYQQLAVLRRMTRDLNVPIEIVAGPIVREEDGLAMSSRNRYLSPPERTQALALSRALTEVAHTLETGEQSAAALETIARNVLTSAGITRIDYISLVHADTLAPLNRFVRPAVLALAIFVGNTRLIDNRIFA